MKGDKKIKIGCLKAGWKLNCSINKNEIIEKEFLDKYEKNESKERWWKSGWFMSVEEN